MSAPTVLAWVEHCLPASSLGRRLQLARDHGLALEVAHRADLTAREHRLLLDSAVPVVSFQAWEMHDLHPLHPDPEQRAAAADHLSATLGLACRWGVPRVLAICGYGQQVCTDPFESCLRFYRDAAATARAAGVRIMLEPLSPLRAAAMTDLEEFGALIDALDAPDVFGTVLDLGHLLDGGHDPAAVLASWRHPLDELQLRAADSEPPPLDLPLARLLSVSPSRPAVVCVEHRGDIDRSDFETLAEHLKRELEMANA